MFKVVKNLNNLKGLHAGKTHIFLKQEKGKTRSEKITRTGIKIKKKPAHGNLIRFDPF